MEANGPLSALGLGERRMQFRTDDCSVRKWGRQTGPRRTTISACRRWRKRCDSFALSVAVFDSENQRLGTITPSKIKRPTQPIAYISRVVGNPSLCLIFAFACCDAGKHANW